MPVPDRHDLTLVGIPVVLAGVGLAAWQTRSGDLWLLGGASVILLVLVADVLFRNPPD